MGRKLEITCDVCGKDITASSNSVDWRIAIKNESIPSRGGVVTDVYIGPIFDRDLYFCSLRCIDAWMRDAVGGVRRGA